LQNFWSKSAAASISPPPRNRTKAHHGDITTTSTQATEAAPRAAAREVWRGLERLLSFAILM